VSTLELTAPSTAQVVCCDIAAYATQRARAEALPGLRQKPSPFSGEPFPASFWKHADDQTLVGLAAVFDAIRNHGLDPTTFHDWGVLAAPRFLGRSALAAALNRFALEGAWGISPHLIPHRSLHSISGTVSQALKIKGPNLGVGGGPQAADEALFAASSMVAAHRLPGVWLVMTGYAPELMPTNPAEGEVAKVDPRSMAGAVALALVSKCASPGRLRLRVACGNGIDAVAWPIFTLEHFLDVLSNDNRAPATRWRLRGGWIALESPGASAEKVA
jgi:hypothetical protein